MLQLPHRLLSVTPFRNGVDKDRKAPTKRGFLKFLEVFGVERYLKLLDKLTLTRQKYLEIKCEILNYGCPSFQITDMPRGGGGGSDRLEDLFDKEMLLGVKIQGLLIAVDTARRELEAKIEAIQNPKARVVHRLRYIHNLTDIEIMDETGFSYWNVKKLFQRNKIGY